MGLKRDPEDEGPYTHRIVLNGKLIHHKHPTDSTQFSNYTKVTRFMMLTSFLVEASRKIDVPTLDTTKLQRSFLS
jgi:hypothetical protein